VVVLTSGRDLAEYGPRGRETPSAAFVAKHRLSGGALRELLAEAS
jgi:hypothetical protein